jgi:hypothetical protein
MACCPRNVVALRSGSTTSIFDLHEPRLIAFLEYLSEDGTEVEYVQIHPGAASFEHHLQVLADAETSYQDTLEATTAIRIYGTPPSRS